MLINLKKIVLIFFILILISALFINHKQFLKLFYPIHYQKLIFSEAAKYELDPYLILSIIYVESKFKPKATSNRGARGLMQIMPQTGLWIAKSLNYENFSTDDLYNPKLNIKYGSWYLSHLKKRFDGNLPVILAAYNGGQGNVDKWLANNEWDGRHENVNKIPFSETRGYVSKVMKIYSRYKYIYNEKKNKITDK